MKIVDKLKLVGLLLFRPSRLVHWMDDRIMSNVENNSATVKYLYYEISRLKREMRYIVAASGTDVRAKSSTYSSFDYQWGHLNAGRNLLSDEQFKREVAAIICEHTQLDAAWFAGKKVLDAGCGSGRFSYGLAALGAEVLAIDQSVHGLEQAERNCQEFADRITFKQHDLLQPLQMDGKFDLVWSFGVLHHTGDTYQGFNNVAACVTAGGYLYLMLYGEPRPGHRGDFTFQSECHRLRLLTANKDYEETIHILSREKPVEELHGWFDAISPAINDTYQFEEIEGWLLDAGFEQIKRTLDSVNHNVIAQKKAGA